MSSVFSSWGNIRQTPFQSMAALMVVITTFFLVYTLTDFLYIGNTVLQYFEAQPEILVFYDVTVSDAQATADAQLIEKLDYVESVTITGKTDAYENYKTANANEPLLLGLLNPELFPASLSIKATSPEGLDKVYAELEKLDGIDEIDYHEDVIDEFLNWTSALRHESLIIVAVFTIQYILVIQVITGMKVAARRRTLNIMSTLGASRAAIKWTFIREAMWIGIVGSLIAFGISYGIFAYIQPVLKSFFGEIPVFPLPAHFFLYQALAGTSIAAFLAAFAAWLSSGRLIKK